MFRVRYVAAVLVGLTVGVAAGWVSGRGFDASHQAAPTRAHARHRPAQELTPPARSDGSARRAAPPGSFTPELQRVQQRIVRCLYDSATWRQQVSCLQGVLRLEIAGSRSLGLSFARQEFRVDVQRPGGSQHT
jgi:hypothetical protein